MCLWVGTAGNAVRESALGRAPSQDKGRRRTSVLGVLRTGDRDREREAGGWNVVVRGLGAHRVAGRPGARRVCEAQQCTAPGVLAPIDGHQGPDMPGPWG